MWVAELHTDQAVGSSVMKARVVTVSGVNGPPSLLPTLSGVGVGKGWDRYRLGHLAVEVLAHAPPLNVQSGHSKVPHQGSSCAAMGPHPEKGEGIRWFSITNTTEILHVGTFAGHTGHRPCASFVT